MEALGAALEQVGWEALSLMTVSFVAVLWWAFKRPRSKDKGNPPPGGT